METYAKRIFAAAATTALLALATAGAASADPTTAPGPGACLGPPGQSGLVQAALASDMAPGQFVSYCNEHGHGQNQDGAGSVS
jgi:hypothetical protein